MKWSLECFGTVGAGDDGVTLHYDDDNTHICFTPALYHNERAFREGLAPLYHDEHSQILCTESTVLVCFDGTFGTPRIEFAVPRTPEFDVVMSQWKEYARRGRHVREKASVYCE